MTESYTARDEEERPDALVAELRRRVEELDARRRHLEAVLEVLPVGVWIADATGRLIARNDAAAEIWGREARLSERPEEHVGDYRAWRMDGTRVRSHEWALARAVRAGEASTAEELEIETPAGERKRILNWASPIRDEGGRITGGVAVNVDVTAQREAEARGLRQDQILASVGQAVIVTDLEGRVSYWNDAAERIYGWTAEEAAGRPVLDLTVPESDRERAEPLLRRLREGKVWSGEFPVRRRDGSTFPARVTLGPIRDAEGRVVGIVGVTTDMTAEKVAERRREELIGALEHERSRLESIFVQAPAFLAVLRGPDYVFELANPAYRAMVGERDLLGLPLAEALPEVRSQGFLELLDQVRESGEPHVGREVRIFLAADQGSGPREIYCNFVYQPVTEVDGSVQRIVVHGVEVTDLVRARQQAERANRAKSDFLATVSHELRTPLNAILGYVDLMGMGVPTEPPSDVVRYLERVRLSARHLQQLIEEVLTVARLEGGRERLELAPVAIEELIDEVRAIMEPATQRKGLALEVETVDLPELIVSDPRKLRQIVVNLLGNAVKFTERGEVQLSFSRAGEDRFTIRVRDTGVGIDPDDLERVFEPFWQGERERVRAEGAGLGLTITRRLTRMLGGRVSVESEPGSGSTFVVELPLRTAPNAHASY